MLLYIALISLAILILGVKLGRPLIVVEAENIHTLLSLLGVPNSIAGDTIYLREGLAFQVTWQCSGMFTLTVYTVAFLAIPRIRGKVGEWLFGASLIYLANLARMIAAILAYRYFGADAFNLVHYMVGPIVLFILLVLILGTLIAKSLRETTQRPA